MTAIDYIKKFFVSIAVLTVLVLCLAGCEAAEDRDFTASEAVETASSTATCPGGCNRGEECRAYDIGRDKVIAIVLGKVPGAVEADIKELECEHERGCIEYEGELFYDGYEYSFQIDGSTGNILKWDVER